jgi:hypothetical protein
MDRFESHVSMAHAMGSSMAQGGSELADDIDHSIGAKPLLLRC